MNCPKCTAPCRVLDSRNESTRVTRRRDCKDCGYRFTTTEKIPFVNPLVGSVTETLAAPTEYVYRLNEKCDIPMGIVTRYRVHKREDGKIYLYDSAERKHVYDLPLDNRENSKGNKREWFTSWKQIKQTLSKRATNQQTQYHKTMKCLMALLDKVEKWENE